MNSSLSDSIKDEFIKQKQKKGRYILTAKADKKVVWDKAAAICLEYGLSAQELVSLVADYYNLKNLYLLPHNLIDKTAYKLLRDFINKYRYDEIVIDPGGYISKSVEDASKEIQSYNGDTINALKSFNTSIPSWVRILLALSCCNNDDLTYIQRFWGLSAKKLLKANPELKNELKSKGIVLPI